MLAVSILDVVSANIKGGYQQGLSLLQVLAYERFGVLSGILQEREPAAHPFRACVTFVQLMVNCLR
jgi:hypothetical protein